MINMKLLDEAFASLPAVFRESHPACGMILGSGWNRAVDELDSIAEVPYSSIPNLGNTGVPGHDGRLVLASVPGHPESEVLVFCGRRHWYEGVGWEAIVMPSDFCRRLGVKNMLITNAAGGIRLQLHPGDVVLIRDHIRMSHQNPLVGPHIPELGPRFPDQSEVYNADLSDIMRQAAMDVDYNLKDGVYMFSGGPSFETPAEIRAYGILGADLVGMSTVPEAIVASAAGIRIIGLSLVSNMAAGISGPHLSHEEVMEVSRVSSPLMVRLVRSFLDRLAVSETCRV